MFDEHPSPQLIHRDFVIERVNAAFVTEFGYAPEEVIGRPVIYLMDEQSSSFLFDQVGVQREKMFENLEVPPERLVRVRMKEGTYAPFATQPNRVSPDGRTICLTIHRLTDQDEVLGALTAASLGFSSAPTNLVSKIVTSLVARERWGRSRSSIVMRGSCCPSTPSSWRVICNSKHSFWRSTRVDRSSC